MFGAPAGDAGRCVRLGDGEGGAFGGRGDPESRARGALGGAEAIDDDEVSVGVRLVGFGGGEGGGDARVGGEEGAEEFGLAGEGGDLDELLLGDFEEGDVVFGEAVAEYRQGGAVEDVADVKIEVPIDAPMATSSTPMVIASPEVT